jgi:hypothetical protein
MRKEGKKRRNHTLVCILTQPSFFCLMARGFSISSFEGPRVSLEVARTHTFNAWPPRLVDRWPTSGPQDVMAGRCSKKYGGQDAGGR